MRAALGLGVAVLLIACTATNTGSGSIPAGGGAGGTPTDAGSGNAGPTTRTLTLNVSGPGTVSGAGITGCRAQCAAVVADGAAVAFIAAPDNGAVFKGWSGACSGTGSCSFTASGDVQITATFTAAPAPDECAGLAPADPGSPVRARLPKGPSDTCTRGYADGSGNVALPTATDPNVARDTIQLFDSSAHALGTYAGFEASLHEQHEGFLVTNVMGLHGVPYLDQVEPNGHVDHEAQLSGNGPVSLEGDAAGGVVIATFPGGGSPRLTSLEAYDAEANLRWRFSPPPFTIYLAHATDRAGNTLLLFRLASQAQGQWFSSSGAAGPSFPLSEPRATALLIPRIGSGFFLQIQEGPGRLAEWWGQFDALATTMAAPPEWLRAYDRRKLHPVHGATAYAFLDPAIPSADCTQHIDVVATSGRNCGNVAFNAGASGSCQTGSIDVGYDGTVIQQLSVSAETVQAGSQTTCTWQWWTGYLR